MDFPRDESSAGKKGWKGIPTARKEGAYAFSRVCRRRVVNPRLLKEKGELELPSSTTSSSSSSCIIHRSLSFVKAASVHKISRKRDRVSSEVDDGEKAATTRAATL